MSLVAAAKRAVLLSGTPALNRPKELYTQATFETNGATGHVET